jgi:hypothetical protein
MAAKDDAKELKSIVDAFKESTKEINNSLKNTASLVGESINPFKEILNISEQLNAHKSKENQLTSDQIKQLSEKLQQEKNNLKESQNSLSLRLTKLKEIQSQQEKNLISVEKNSKAYKKTEAALKGTLAEIKNNERAQEDLAEQIDSTNKEVENLENSLKKAAQAAQGFETLGKIGGSLDKVNSPLEGMLNPLNLINKLIGFIVNTVLEFDQRLGDTAKSMNLTYKEAENSNRAMIKFAQSTGDAFLNSQNLNKTVVDLNKNLGTSIKFEQLTGALKEDVALMSKLENMAGLTAEETQGILQYTLATNQSSTKATKDLMANYRVAGLKRGVVLNEKDALKEVSKLSNAIKLSTAGGAAGLAKSVAAAKALGADLGKVDDIASSILNFEESIESELSAELLTGKQLNLEKAREAALNNDLATLSDEIKKNVGSAAEFNEMNRISQEAIAKSVGMSREELATTLTNQEALKNISASSVEDAYAQYELAKSQGKEKEFLNQLGDEALEKQFKQQSGQEELVELQKNQADKILDTIKGFDEIKKEIKDMYLNLMKVIDGLGGMKTILTVIGGIIALKMVKGVWDFASGVGKGIKAAQELATVEKKGAIASIISGAWESLGPIPFVGAALATVAIGGAIAYLMSQMNSAKVNDGIISPSTGGGGYGSRMLFGPEGAISFNNKDTIVAGTDLFKADDMVSAPKGAVQVGGGSSSREIADLKGAIMALASRPVNVSIDGKKVIEATTGAQPNTQGVESAKNSFKMQ